MTTPGQPPRGGFLANISKALTPPIIEDEDPTVPLVRPRSVSIASILVALAAVGFIFLGAVSLANLNDDLGKAVINYNSVVATCQSDYSGIGDAAVAKQNATADQTKSFTSCKGITSTTVTPDMLSAAKSRASLVSWVMVVFGVIAMAGAWFLFTGVAWARRLLVGLVVVTMLMTLLLQISHPITLVATLFIVAAVLLCYLGKGGVFFTKALLRRKAAR